MITYPMQFDSESQSTAGMKSLWTSHAAGLSSSISIPPEFEGPGGGLSPEDLFNQALANCFLATFKVIAEHSRLTFDRIAVKSRLVVAPDESKKPTMKEFNLSATIFNPSNAQKAILIAGKASETGFVLNSVKTKCHFEFTVE